MDNQEPGDIKRAARPKNPGRPGEKSAKPTHEAQRIAVNPGGTEGTATAGAASGGSPGNPAEGTEGILCGSGRLEPARPAGRLVSRPQERRQGQRPRTGQCVAVFSVECRGCHLHGRRAQFRALARVPGHLRTLADMGHAHGDAARFL